MQNNMLKTVPIIVINDKITYGNEKNCHSNKLGKVVWEADGPFCIQFLTTSPFDDAQFRSAPTNHGKHRAERTGNGKAQSGSEHPYAVAVDINGQVYLDANCPAIIIE